MSKINWYEVFVDPGRYWEYYKKYNWWEIPYPYNDVRPLEDTHTIEVEDE